MTQDPPPSQRHLPPERPHPLLSGLGADLPAEVGPLVVRQPQPQEAALHHAAADSAYGLPFTSQDPAQERRYDDAVPPHNRRIVVEALPDGGERILGGAVRFDMSLSLPGGGRVPVGALSAVGVEPGAQGRGAFRALVQEHLDGCRERGEAASVLMASQVPLYPRFGYGPATHTANWAIDASAAGLRPDAPAAGRVLVEHARGEHLHRLLNQVWEAAANARAGALSRSPAWWNVMFGPEEGWIGGGKVMVARHLSRPGYVLYTVGIEGGRQGLAESEVTIREIVASDVAAELDLWRFVADLPWARTIKWQYGPIDPAPLFWLADPRQLRRMAHFDFLWLRPLDVPALVDARDFAADGAVALEVADTIYPDQAGRFDLQVRDGTGTWRPGTREAELRLRIADLGELWLGASSAAQLLAMGRIGGDRSAAHRLDAMLAVDGPPRCGTKF